MRDHAYVLLTFQICHHKVVDVNFVSCPMHTDYGDTLLEPRSFIHDRCISVA